DKMHSNLLPLVHKDIKATYDKLSAEQVAFYQSSRERQVVAEMRTQLAEINPRWLSAEKCIRLYTTSQIFLDMGSRRDARSRLMMKLISSYLPVKTTEAMLPDFQASFVDQVVENGEKTPLEVVRALDYKLVVCYGDVERRWHEVMENFPWDDNSRATKQILTYCVESFLDKERVHEENGKKIKHSPVLTYLEFRKALPYLEWERYLPLELKAAAAEERFNMETNHQQQSAESEVKKVGVGAICNAIPTNFFKGIFLLANERMGFQVPGGKTVQPKIESESKADMDWSKAAKEKAGSKESKLPLPKTENGLKSEPDSEKTGKEKAGSKESKIHPHKTEDGLKS
ncbi:MAG: hypothetical protein WCL37_06010, partial [Chrysiogenales bacterium]